MTNQPRYKYRHFFSLNFEMPSNLEGDTEEEYAALVKEAYSYVKDLVANGTYSLEWYDAEDAEDDYIPDDYTPDIY
jgi:hypothetical protein